jgi:hypothetical protein
MKHRLIVPGADDWLHEHAAIHDFAERAGWIIRMESVNRSPWQPKNVELRLMSRRTPGASLDVASGAILIYDDVEQSLGVTPLTEPQDAVPPQPKDRMPWRW